MSRGHRGSGMSSGGDLRTTTAAGSADGPRRPDPLPQVTVVCSLAEELTSEFPSLPILAVVTAVVRARAQLEAQLGVEPSDAQVRAAARRVLLTGSSPSDRPHPHA